jgi:hypothetical protein
LGRLDTGARQPTTFDIPFTQRWLLCFDAVTGKLAAGIECGLPLGHMAIA